MKQSLQLRLGQHLTMTPQLQQAIRLLQLSTLELQAEIQEVLESNPLLEVAEEGEEVSSPEEPMWEPGEIVNGHDANESSTTLESDNFSALEAPAPEPINRDADLEQLTEIPTDLPVDSTWDDIYDSAPATSSAPDQDGQNFESQGTVVESLRDHLLWQMGLTPFSEVDEAVATAIIDSVNEEGYLTTSLENIYEGLKDECGIDFDEAEVVLRRVQHFDPPGVAARDLRECLLIQLNQFDVAAPFVKEARLLVSEHLALLAARDFTQLMRRLKLSQPELQQIIHLIQSLNPRPGSAIQRSQPEYVIPDVVVRKLNGAWRVELNQEAVPRLRINANYANMIRRADNSADNTFLKNNFQEARWFIKSLQSRNETLLKVASCIVERQRGFLEHGEEAMKALVLHDIAETVGMHESTISRVTNQKFMHTPRGLFELKYFFSSHVTTAAGGECSATAIRALIKKFVAAESPAKPLSDSRIAKVLSDQGINVARRTIAKYREALSIPPSNERKRLS